MDCPLTAPDHFFIQLGLSALGLILGWVIVHKLACNRDLDKERRTLVSIAAASQIENINSLMIDARKYHTGQRSEETEQSIKMVLQDIAESVGALRKIVRDDAAVSRAQGAIKGLRIAITGKHFEDEHNGPLVDRSEILENIASESLRAKRALLILQHVQYQHMS